MIGPPRGARGRSSRGDRPVCSARATAGGEGGARRRERARSVPIGSVRSVERDGRGRRGQAARRRRRAPARVVRRSRGTAGGRWRVALGGEARSAVRRPRVGESSRRAPCAGSRAPNWSAVTASGLRGRSRIASSSSPSSRCRISASGRCSAWSRLISRQPGEMVRAVLAPRSGLADCGQESLGEVVPHGPGRDPGQVGELGQGVAVVVWHGGMMTV